MKPFLPRRSRPALDLVESTRRVLLILLVVSFMIIFPLALSGAHGLSLLPTLLGAAALVGSWCWGYTRGRAPLATDLLDATALTVVASAAADPAILFTVIFPLIWFRSLYGTARHAYFRCALPIASIIGATALGPGVNWGAAVGTLPTLLLTAAASRKLSEMMTARERAGVRDAAVARLGATLLGVTDRAEIRQLAWSAISRLCAATPGLRVLELSGAGPLLAVEAVAGPFEVVPAVVHGSVLADADDRTPGSSGFRTELDRTAGAQCDWRPLPAADTDVATLLVGHPARLPDEVLASVTSVRVLLALALRNSAVHAELSTQARVDSLTGLANRACFRSAVAEALRDREDAPVTVLFVDLDDFKDVNDRLGHAAGDDVLRYVAGCLCLVTRNEDLCARLGGDEFAVLLRGADPVAAGQVAERLVLAVAAPVAVTGGTAKVGASVGVAIASSGIGLEELVRQADVAMYAAKALGKGRVQMFERGLLEIEAAQSVG